jgi:hypothetical protein
VQVLLANGIECGGTIGVFPFGALLAHTCRENIAQRYTLTSQGTPRSAVPVPVACCPVHVVRCIFVFCLLSCVRLSSVTSCLLQCCQRLSVACCVLHVACAQGCAFSSGCGAWRPLQRCLSPLVPCSLPLGRRCPLQRCNAARCNAASCDASTVPICRGAGPRLHFVALRPIERGEVRYEWPQSYESPI